MISSRSVTAASAAAVLQASSDGASTPLMSLRFSSATSVRSNPSASLRRASRLAYSHVGRHPFFFVDVAQPAAEDQEPVAELHDNTASPAAALTTSAWSQSARRAKGSKPRTRGASATKFESALMS